MLLQQYIFTSRIFFKHTDTKVTAKKKVQISNELVVGSFERLRPIYFLLSYLVPLFVLELFPLLHLIQRITNELNDMGFYSMCGF